jgi:hypothetical protein
MNNYKFRMSKLEMAMNCTAGYYKSMEAVSEPSAVADDGTGTHLSQNPLYLEPLLSRVD